MSSMEEDLKIRKENLIVHLRSEGYLKTRRVEEAFMKIPRENFVPLESASYAYSDNPLPIGFGQTISAPHMVAIMTELLEPKRTDRVLEIGAGSGYQAAILSVLTKKIYTIELDPQLAEFAQENLKKAGIRNVEVLAGDGSKGLPKEAPFDKMIATCAMPSIQKPLFSQLKEGGLIVAPIGPAYGIQTLTSIRKHKGKPRTKEYFGCVFVPLRQ